MEELQSRGHQGQFHTRPVCPVNCHFSKENEISLTGMVVNACDLFDLFTRLALTLGRKTNDAPTLSKTQIVPENFFNKTDVHSCLSFLGSTITSVENCHNSLTLNTALHSWFPCWPEEVNVSFCWFCQKQTLSHIEFVNVHFPCCTMPPFSGQNLD